jgi:hypothetical protein
MALSSLFEFTEAVVSLPSKRASVTRTSFGCTVVAIGGQTIALEPDDPMLFVGLTEHVPDAYLSYDLGGTTLALRGTLVSLDSNADLRFICTDPPVRGGREYTRVAVVMPVNVCRRGSNELSCCATVDVSATGLLVTSPLKVANGDRVDVELYLPRSPHASGTARVVRAVGGRIALQLEEPRGELGRVLGAFVVDHNREIVRNRRRNARPLAHVADF